MAERRFSTTLVSDKDMKKAFKKFDVDKSGYVSISEAQAVLGDLLGYDRSQTAQFLRRFSYGDDDQLSYEEFVEFFGKLQEKMQEIMAVFCEIDVNKDGEITLDEARQGMRQLAFNDDEIETLLQVYDANGDGLLQFEEFVKLWNAK